MKLNHKPLPPVAVTVNYKLIISHTLAGIFLIWALNELVYLYDTELLRIYDEINIIDAWRMDNKAERISKFLLLKYTSSYISLIISLIISLSITLKKKLGGINSFIAFFVIAVLVRLGIITSEVVEKVVYFPGEILFGFSVKSVSLNGILLLLISLWLYFSKFIYLWIKKNGKKNKYSY